MGMAGGVLGMGAWPGATCRVPNRVRWHLVSPSPTYISRAICFTQSRAIISSGLTSLSLSRSLSLSLSLSGTERSPSSIASGCPAESVDGVVAEGGGGAGEARVDRRRRPAASQERW